MGVDAIFYVYLAAAVVGAGASIRQARLTAETEQLRRQNLRSEIRQAALQAEEEVTNRWLELRQANAEVVVNAGMVDPYMSQSLLAIRKNNLRKTDEAERNIRLNLMFKRAGIANRIAMSEATESTANDVGFLNAASSILGGVAGGMTYGSGSEPVVKDTNPKKGKKRKGPPW